MTRMSREFSLVLLGSGLLTAGYFMLREDDKLFANDEQKAQQQVAGSSGHHHRPHFVPLVFLHGGGFSGGRYASPAASTGGIARGGFGGIGAHAAGS